jgi:hypothetical protein
VQHQLGAQRHGVHRLPAPEDLAHALVDLRVGLAVEVVGPEDLGDDVQTVVVEEDPAEDRLLGVERVGRHAAFGHVPLLAIPIPVAPRSLEPAAAGDFHFVVRPSATLPTVRPQPASPYPQAPVDNSNEIEDLERSGICGAT